MSLTGMTHTYVSHVFRTVMVVVLEYVKKKERLYSVRRRLRSAPRVAGRRGAPRRAARPRRRATTPTRRERGPAARPTARHTHRHTRTRTGQAGA